MNTKADFIAKFFSNDGQVFAREGRDLDDFCRSHQPVVEQRGDGHDQRFVFADGSWIAIRGDAWWTNRDINAHQLGFDLVVLSDGTEL